MPTKNQRLSPREQEPSFKAPVKRGVHLLPPILRSNLFSPRCHGQFSSTITQKVSASRERATLDTWPVESSGDCSSLPNPGGDKNHSRQLAVSAGGRQLD